MMTPLRVLSIFGTRPEAVKMAPVVQALKSQRGVESRVCVTAQHREMLDQVLGLFHIQPDHDLDLMRPDQSLVELTASILTRLDPVLEKERPDWVLVQGDTTTVMTAALAAFYRGIRVGHVEAGLRTGDKRQPFPEEINRHLTTVLADLHFAPTERSRLNLLHEGVPETRIRVTGNTVIDALQQIIRTDPPAQVREWLDEWGVRPGGRRLALVTAHRRENFGRPIEHICEGLKTLSHRYGNELHIVYPVHLNPNIQEPVYRLLAGIPKVSLIKPVDYISLVHLIKNAYIVLTDSGGIQEEAAGLGKPTLVLREVTERPEGVDAGVLRLVGSNKERIVREAARLLDDPDAYAEMARMTSLFGDGKAAGRIVEALLNHPKRPA
jgi:UDP-N-acetylglucosamine 2-epimerase (non-hydrolysing)